MQWHLLPSAPSSIPLTCPNLQSLPAHSAVILKVVGGKILGNPGPRKCSPPECPVQTSYSKGSLALMLPEILQEREPSNFIFHCLEIS